jgi:hypothetical protein
MQINREALAWAAGLFDGEGSVTHGGGYDNRYPVIQITQVEPKVLHRFRNAVGVGTVLGPYSNGTRSKRTYHFCAYGFEKTQAIGAMLWTFLSPVKRSQFAAKIATAKDWDRRQWTPTQREKIGAGIRAYHEKRRQQKFVGQPDHLAAAQVNDVAALSVPSAPRVVVPNPGS